MAVIVGRLARQGILEGTIRLGSDTIKCLIVDSSFSCTAALDYVDDGTANDPLSHETAVSGYAGGYGGASRLALGTKTFPEDVGGDRVGFKFGQLTWPSLASGTVLAGVVFYKNGTSDTDSIFIAWDNAPDVTSNGLDVFYDCAVDGLLKM